MIKSVQTSETAPIASVETLGVRWLGWIRPNAFGIAPKRAMDNVVRAVGRIVVCVDAEAEVRTVMMRSLSSGDPNTFALTALKMTILRWTRYFGAAYSCFAAETT